MFRKINLLSLAIVIFFQFFLPHSTQAEINHWGLTGLEGKTVQALTDYRALTPLYAGTKEDGVYKYDGNNWTPLKPDLLASKNIQSLMVLDAMLYAGIFDGGVKSYSIKEGTWSNPIPGLDSTKTVDHLVIYPFENKDTLFASTPLDGVFKLNADKNQMEAFNKGLNDKSVRAMAASSTKFYIATNEGVFLFDINKGWVAKSNGLSDLKVSALTFFINLLRAGTENGRVFHYRGVNDQWTLAEQALINKKINAFIVFNKTLYAGTDGQGVFSFDGSQWKQAGLDKMMVANAQNVLSFAVFGNKLYAGTGNGVYEIQYDKDGDGVLEPGDNCPNDANPDQKNTDDDIYGDICDVDDDNDKVLDEKDNCPMVANPDQKNTDGQNDGGDACDGDMDSDDVPNGADNCLITPNTDQKNLDGDAEGDACDSDIDGDGVKNDLDNCPMVANPDQKDSDSDHPSVCDETPQPVASTQPPASTQPAPKPSPTGTINNTEKKDFNPTTTQETGSKGCNLTSQASSPIFIQFLLSGLVVLLLARWQRKRL
ncbi:MAG: thrombospondin type 3 repeat-containing protein [Deltaproteobacteria bacterium]|nr:thrombospondin type 3 repeat-containing protein [Deltaproteobacteria bacterium]